MAGSNAEPAHDPAGRNKAVKERQRVRNDCTPAQAILASNTAAGRSLDTPVCLTPALEGREVVPPVPDCDSAVTMSPRVPFAPALLPAPPDGAQTGSRFRRS